VQLDKLAYGSSVTYYTGPLAADGSVTIPEGVVVTAGNTLNVPEGKSFVIKGGLMANDNVTLSGPVTIDATGGFGLVAGKKVTLVTDAGKIVGTTYSITNSGTETGGTVTAGSVSDTSVVFKADRIDGYTTDGPIVGDTSVTSAATLALGGDITATNGSVFAVTGNTAVGGVILDVSAKGVITVAANQNLTLKAGRGSLGDAFRGSGGIFTKVVTSGDPNSVVKANGATLNGSGAFADATVLAGAVVEVGAASADGNVGTGGSKPVANGVIGSTSEVIIDKEDTFAVGGYNNNIVVTHP
jgi:hypothetical protein